MGLIPATTGTLVWRLSLVWAIIFACEATTLTGYIYMIVLLYSGLVAIAVLIDVYGRRKVLGDISPKPGRYVLITGACSGIGAAIAEDFGHRGYSLVLVSNEADRIERKRIELSTRFPTIVVKAFDCDLCRPDVADIFAEKLSELKVTEIAILCNNAGAGLRQPFSTSPPTAIRMVMSLNNQAVVLLTRHFLPEMLARGAGRFLNISSIAGEVSASNLSVYHASKSFATQFSLSLRYELRNTGVAITCCAPGATDTEFAIRSQSTDALCFNLPHCHLPQAVVASAAVVACLDGVATVVPPSPSNWLFTSVVVPFFPEAITTSIVSFMWGPVSQLPTFVTKVLGMKVDT
eukprot:m.68452 g.68452  ORF g.68452 m.68452 type:complete len:348 (-) comp23954_c0_seq2:156-1199(-)